MAMTTEEWIEELKGISVLETWGVGPSLLRSSR